MYVRVRGQRARGLNELLDGRIKVPLFFENAAEVITRNSVRWIELNGGLKRSASFVRLSHLVEDYAKVDVRFDPLWRELDRVAVTLHRLGQQFDARFACERHIKPLLGSLARHRMQFRGWLGHAEGENPLLANWVEGFSIRARRDNKHLAALVENLKLLQRQCRPGELLLDKADGAAQTARGDFLLRDALDGAKGDEVAKAVKAFAPAGLRCDQPQPLPIAKAANVESQNAFHFPPRISLWQLGYPRFNLMRRFKLTSGNDYAPCVKFRA